MEVASPCVKICVLNADQVCIGCGRTLDEIGAWPQAGEELRQQVIDAAQLRLDSIQRLHKIQNQDQA